MSDWGEKCAYPLGARMDDDTLELCTPYPPFGLPPAFDPAWRTETVTALAKGIEADAAFDRMPILADALEEAGCDNPAVLGHCRGRCDHHARCWVLNAVFDRPVEPFPPFPEPPITLRPPIRPAVQRPRRGAGGGERSSSGCSVFLVAWALLGVFRVCAGTASNTTTKPPRYDPPWRPPTTYPTLFTPSPGAAPGWKISPEMRDEIRKQERTRPPTGAPDATPSTSRER